MNDFFSNFVNIYSNVIIEHVIFLICHLIPKLMFCRNAPEVISDGHYTHASDVWTVGILAWELYASYKTGQQIRAISLPYFWLENQMVIFKAIAFGKRTLRLYTQTKVHSTSSRATKPKKLKEIRVEE